MFVYTLTCSCIAERRALCEIEYSYYAKWEFCCHGTAFSFEHSIIDNIVCVCVCKCVGIEVALQDFCVVFIFCATIYRSLCVGMNVWYWLGRQTGRRDRNFCSPAVWLPKEHWTRSVLQCSQVAVTSFLIWWEVTRIHYTQEMHITLLWYNKCFPLSISQRNNVTALHNGSYDWILLPNLRWLILFIQLRYKRAQPNGFHCIIWLSFFFAVKFLVVLCFCIHKSTFDMVDAKCDRSN